MTSASLAAGRPTKVHHAASFIDGIGSSEVLDEMWPLVRETVDQAISCINSGDIAEMLHGVLAGA